MKVRELMKHLETFPEDASVLVEVDGAPADIAEVELSEKIMPVVYIVGAY
jgi:hypothetical protein